MQLNLLDRSEIRFAKTLSHGGVALRRRRKTRRPLIPGAIHHVVLKSSLAKGRYCMRRHSSAVDKILRAWAQLTWVELLDLVNMGNHIHLKVRFRDPRHFQKFLRSSTGVVARRVTGARKGHPFGRFWDGLAFTRALSSRLEELRLDAYLKANRLEQRQSYAVRRAYLRAHERWVRQLLSVRAIRGTRQYVRDIAALLEETRLRAQKDLLEAALGP